jgi:two-component system cell cycle response regulator DivK
MVPEFPNLKVLLVEDDEINIYVAERILSRKFKVKVARNGLEALHMASREVFDVLMVDINLKHSVDGTEVLEEVRKDSLNRDAQIFAVTGMAMPEDKDHYLAMGFDRFFTKPVNFQEIALAVMEACPSKVL